jgi:hypothetical protein
MMNVKQMTASELSDWAMEYRSSDTGDAQLAADALAELENRAKQRDVLLPACQAALAFHTIAPWNRDAQLLWMRLTGSSEATTKVVCDVLRKALEEK